MLVVVGVSPELDQQAVSAGNAVSYDELIDELWYDRRLNSARNVLHTNVTRLRRLFEEAQAGETMDRAPSILKRPPGRLTPWAPPLCGPDGIPTGAHSPIPSVIHGRHA
jgi:hypothetical protein